MLVTVESEPLPSKHSDVKLIDVLCTLTSRTLLILQGVTVGSFILGVHAGLGKLRRPHLVGICFHRMSNCVCELR